MRDAYMPVSWPLDYLDYTLDRFVCSAYIWGQYINIQLIGHGYYVCVWDSHNSNYILIAFSHVISKWEGPPEIAVLKFDFILGYIYGDLIKKQFSFISIFSPMHPRFLYKD